MTWRAALVACAAWSLLALTGCTRDSPAGQPTLAGVSPWGSAQASGTAAPSTGTPDAYSSPGSRPASSQSERTSPLPGMPPPLSATDVWAADRPNRLSTVVQGMPYRIYVPNSLDNTVTIINPRSYTVIRTIRVGHEPQHVVPSWDLKTLWVNNDLGNSVTPIDPRTGHVGRPLAVHDPYNLYFTPDGKHAIVMASNDRLIVFAIRTRWRCRSRFQLGVPVSIMRISRRMAGTSWSPASSPATWSRSTRNASRSLAG